MHEMRSVEFRQVSCERSGEFTWNLPAATVGWPQQANETGMKKAAEPTMTASFRQKRQRENDSFPQFFSHNTHTIPMVFVPASAKRKCAFGLVTCRLDSYATLVGFNFRLK